MKYILSILVLFSGAIQAQNKSTFITAVDFEQGKEISYKANLNEGKLLDDLSWAWNSNNACFPKTQKHKFTGKHVLFTGIIPAYSDVEIIIIPTNKKDNLSIYAYQIQPNEDFVVPNLPHCITCEADHKWDYQKRNRPKQKHIRRIDNIISLSNSYRIVIGVAGADNLEESEFIIVIKTKKVK
jgi:hypothetical protein